MKIYTRGGDKGRTSLFDGTRVDKDAARIEALGTVDELVAALGLAKVAPTMPHDLLASIEAVQKDLYLAMADIAGATPSESAEGSGEAAGLLNAAAVSRLEREIDALDSELPRLTDFIIPGTSPASAALHLARTVCRRAERRLIVAGRTHRLPGVSGIYLNRLADLLFTMARWADRAEPRQTFRGEG